MYPRSLIVLCRFNDLEHDLLVDNQKVHARGGNLTASVRLAEMQTPNNPNYLPTMILGDGVKRSGPKAEHRQ